MARFHDPVPITGSWNRAIQTSFSLLHQGLQEHITKISWAVFRSESISVKFLFSAVINLSTVRQNLLESHDLAILLRSDGNQAIVE